MESSYQTKDVLQNDIPQETPKSLRTLTTLTFIGCGLAFLSVVLGPFFTKDYTTQRESLEKTLDESGGSGFAADLVRSQLESLERNRAYFDNMYENRYILFGSMALFAVMCLIGAMRMRKLRKSGFPIYTIGELAPIAVNIALLGFAGDGTWKTYVGYLIPIIFVALYASQRKYLTRE